MFSVARDVAVRQIAEQIIKMERVRPRIDILVKTAFVRKERCIQPPYRFFTREQSYSGDRRLLLKCLVVTDTTRRKRGSASFHSANRTTLRLISLRTAKADVGKRWKTCARKFHVQIPVIFLYSHRVSSLLCSVSFKILLTSELWYDIHIPRYNTWLEVQINRKYVKTQARNITISRNQINTNSWQFHITSFSFPPYLVLTLPPLISPNSYHISHWFIFSKRLPFPRHTERLEKVFSVVNRYTECTLKKWAQGQSRIQFIVVVNRRTKATLRDKYQGGSRIYPFLSPPRGTSNPETKNYQLPP